jgi:hypothetical protein
LESAERRERKRVEGIEEQKRKETLAQNEQALEAHFEMLGHAKG